MLKKLKKRRTKNMLDKIKKLERAIEKLKWADSYYNKEECSSYNPYPCLLKDFESDKSMAFGESEVNYNMSFVIEAEKLFCREHKKEILAMALKNAEDELEEVKNYFVKNKED
jgi:hypothetical protein